MHLSGEAPENRAKSTRSSFEKAEERPHEACGVVGLFKIENAAQLAALGLHALQHRGQESAGIASNHNGQMHLHLGQGLVANVFGQNEAASLPGTSAIGHVRYSNAKSNKFINVQPLLATYSGGETALAHNGSLTRGQEFQAELLRSGSLLQTSTDAELFLHLLARGQATENQAIATVLSQAGPAFALVMLFKDRLLAARDPWGFRPLALGRLDSGYVVASESCAFDQMGARFEREIMPGELLCITEQGCESIYFGNKQDQRAACLLELIYFSRPDSIVFGHTPHIFRRASGRILAQEHPVNADVVVAIPDSGFSAAMGFAEELGLPLERGLIRNHYVGRSFIAPGQSARSQAVRMKHNVVREVVKGKRVALVDDSLIRGTTTAALGKELRDAGAREVHLRIACPPTRHPCRYGVDFPDHSELMAYRYNLEEIKQQLNMDSLGYLSLEGLYTLLKTDEPGFCTACWSGNYPVK